MLKQFLSFKREKQEEQEALFLQPGWGAPSQNRLAPSEYVEWSEVQTFLQMAEQALAVRSATNEHLRTQLATERSEKSEVQKTSSAAQEESVFLAEHMQSLMDEWAALRKELERAQRAQEYLTSENELLRQELLEGAALGEESGAMLQLLARREEELRGAQAELLAAQQRNVQLENDNVQLQARVSALERAHTAQATAMLSCLEESERVRLQQLSISIPDSPQVAAHPPRRCELASDGGSSTGADACAACSSAYTDALDLGSDGSYVSCITPYGSSATGGAAADSIFRSASSSPSPGGGGATSKQQPCGGSQPPGSGGMIKACRG